MTEAPLINIELINRVEQISPVVVSLTMQNLHTLFERQAQVDTSEDHPELLLGFRAEITPKNELHIYAPYRISSSDDSTKREELIIEGLARNDNEGALVDKVGVQITPISMRGRVLDAFGRSDDEGLDLPDFIRLILEDSLEGRVIIARMGLNGDKLTVALERPIK